MGQLIMSQLNKIKRICLLLDEPKIIKCVAMGLDKMVKENDVAIPLVIIRKQTSWQLKLRFNQRILASLIIYTRRMLRIKSWFPEKVPISKVEALKNSRIIYSEAERAGKFGTRIPKSTIERIRSEDIDLILRHGFGILKGTILNCVPYGVLSFHGGDIEKYRGGGARIQAYVNNEAYIYIVAQKLNEKLDAGQIVLKTPVYIENLKSYKEVDDKINETIVRMISESIRRMNTPNFELYTPDFSNSKYYKIPNISNLRAFNNTDFRL